MAKKLRAERVARDEIRCSCPVCDARLEIDAETLYVSAIPSDTPPEEDPSDESIPENGRAGDLEVYRKSVERAGGGEDLIG